MAAFDLTRLPETPQFVHFGKEFGRRFIVTVDTEEEFDWTAPIERDRHTVDSIPMLRRFQEFCEGHGVVPIYLMDYPIANSPAAVDALGEAIATGRAEAGIQLHPWVNPPFDEEVTERNTYAGNLPVELEREKFRRLRDLIETNFATKPLIYRAGRYGLGPDSAAMLAEAGVAIDSSVRSLFDYSAHGGPNYRQHPLRPYWIDRSAGLMELPLTTAFWGPLKALGPWIYPRLWRLPGIRGALSHLRLLERIPLTPEGVTAGEMLWGIDAALRQDLPVLVFSFHSPSLAPGYTPYVRTAADLDTFYDWWRIAFDHLAKRGVKPSCVKELVSSVALA